MVLQSKYDGIKFDFDRYMNVVINYFDIDSEKMFHSNEIPCVDARYCLVYLLCEKYSDYELSKVCKISKSCVNKIRNRFNERLYIKSFKSDYNNIKNIICSN